MTSAQAIEEAPRQDSIADDGDAPDYALEAVGLTKKYRASGGQPGKLALDHVDLRIPRGSLFGLLGPNGAGKSTFINILAGLVVKTEGTAKVWDHDIDTQTRLARASIGVVPQELNIDPFFTPQELLEVQAGLYGVPKSERRTEEVLRLVGLDDKRKAYARTLSGGMRRRLLIGKAMVHNPPVLVLDEPTAGVDIELRRQLWENVVELNRRGTTVLLTTHYLEEAQELCDRIAIINHGKVVANDEKSALLGRLDAKTLRFTVREKVSSVPDALKPFDPQIVAADGAEHPLTEMTVGYRPSVTNAGDIVGAIYEAGLTLVDLTTEETDLEDIFLQLTRDADASRA
ncbi:ABC transporter ATP-binding protein [Marivibrio halodurans]|uniref:ABC transporter ATP-binding protein n=1 Tax=Marivibrio halodurans TaxID=2039722 RepID=A0A8J7V082_9PROT|nr:ABC transporter ATP-binding protein [Marivibrio halodurans]MBP5856501.1 ABC transporter ATP-binding protein [Marivibrio halodurans]